MLLQIPRLIIKVLLGSFTLWILLSTAIPQVTMKFTEPQIQTNKFRNSMYPYNSLISPTPLPIRDSTVYFVIGHPDDEVMFFSPALVEILKAKHHNRVKIVCFSKGDAIDTSIGEIRATELRNSARIVGVQDLDVIVLDNYKDGSEWSTQGIAASLGKIVKKESNAVLVTFDDKGVLGHLNHVALYHGTKKFYDDNLRDTGRGRMYVLKSLNFWEKYSFTLLTNIELFVDVLSRLVFNVLHVNVNVSFFNSPSDLRSSIRVYSDLNMLSVSYAAMAYGHFSQMVWFRYGWLTLSRYLNFNHLIQI